ncbi:uncharacterized protein [Primulina huaijiensis]|uniref:uncharacterized protein n=1 Tax=Primulina huaijiensis TaxID=1492673 RepID=UPI003CC75EB3
MASACGEHICTSNVRRKDIKLLIAEEERTYDGRIFILSVATYALLDSRATHSFIYETFFKRLNIIPEDMRLGFKVSIPSGDHMVTSSIVKNLELRLQKDMVRTNLIVLPMLELNIILGMDWLSLNGALIDFRQRSVSIRPPREKSLRQQRTSKCCTLSPASVQRNL